MADTKMKKITVACESDGFSAVDVKVTNPAIIGVFEGIVQQMDTPNQNKRRYTKKFWDKWMSSDATKQKLEGKLLLGQYSHPRNLDDGTFFENLTTHAVTGLRIEGNNIIGKIEVFNTSAGKDLKTLLDAGVKLGISSRALAVSEQRGEFEDIEDGEIFGWDFVIDPSVKCAIPKAVGESIDYSKGYKTVMESFSRSESDDAKVVMEALGYKKIEEEVEMTVEAAPEVKEEVEEDLSVGEVSDEDIVRILEVAAKDKVDLQEKIADLSRENEALTEKINKVRSNYTEMKETFVEIAEGMKKKLKEEKAAREELEKSFEERLKLADDIVGKMRFKLDSVSAKSQKNEQNSADIIAKLRDMVNEQKTKIDEVTALNSRYNKALAEMKSLVGKLQNRSNDTEVRLAAESLIHRLGADNNDKLKSLIESCKTVEDISRVESRFIELNESLKEALPVAHIKMENVAKEIEAELGNLHVDPEVARLEGLIRKANRR